MDMETLERLGAFLQVYGGWGVSLIMIVLLVWLYRHTSKMQEKMNENLMMVAKEYASALAHMNIITANSQRQAQDVSNQLARSDALMNRLENRLDKSK